MALDDVQKAERRALLAEANVPDKYFNYPLTKHGDAGVYLREYIKSDYSADARDFRGAVVVNRKPGLAVSFARDIVVLGASVNFFYLQTFANKFTSLESMPHAFVIEWFEQNGVPSPFTGAERFRLETAISQMLDQGIMFYLFTSTAPETSQWWSRNFIDTLLDNSRLIEVNNAPKRDGQGTPFVSNKTQRQEDAKASKRVGIR